MSKIEARNWKGDLTGGLVATIMSLPEAMAYGVLIFSAIDSALVAEGLLAGLIAVTLANIGSAIVLGNPIISSSPFSLVTLMIASQLPVFLGYFFPPGQLTPLEHETLLGLVFFSIFLAGFFQIIFGKFHLGDLVKFVPQPVVSGLFNGTAILILQGQVQNLLGIENQTQFWLHLKPLNIGIGLLTWASIEVGNRRLKKIPPALLALGIGISTYYILQNLGYSNQLGPTIGKIPQNMPLPTALLPIVQLTTTPQFWQYLPHLILFALGLAVTASTGTLIACIAGDEVQARRTNANHELVGQGIGNMLAATFGGIMSSGSPSRTVANYQYGGRSRLSKVFIGLFSLVAIWFLAPWLGLLPQVVLAGLLISLAFSLLRKKTWHQMVDLFSHNNMKRQRSAVNLIISLAVSIFLIWQGILPSLGMGLLFSLLHFVIRMGRGIVTDYRRGNEKHSFAIRSQEEFDELTRNGQCIHILHLQGSLFFGTADQLAVQIEEITHEGAHWIVLDLTEVVELDDTGNNIMAQLINRCRSNGVEFAFAVRTESTLSELLTASGLLEVIGVEQVFPSLNHALAWAEDQFLERHLPDTQILKENALQTVSAFRKIDEDHMIKIQEYLTWHEMPAGSQLIEQSSMEDWLIILVRGRVRVELRSNLDEKPRTVSYLCSGRLIGEFAFVDHAPRSASVITECEVAYWQMNYPDFLKLQQEDYWAAHQLMQGIAKEISTKLRISDQMIH